MDGSQGFCSPCRRSCGCRLLCRDGDCCLDRSNSRCLRKLGQDERAGVIAITAVAGIIGLIGSVVFIAGLVAAVKGSLRFLRIGSRKPGALLMVGAVVLLAVGGALAPKPKMKQVATTAPASPTSTSSATVSSPTPSPTLPAGTVSPSTATTRPTEPSPMRTTPAAALPTTPTPVATKPAPAVTTPAVMPTTPAPVQTTQASVPTPPPPAATCAATMANATPGDGGTDSVNVTSNVPNAPIAVTLYYKTTTSHDSGTTDGAGAGTVPFGLGRPTIGYTVDVSVSVGGRATCSTSFTPQ